ncbi:helix-turn-helix transcriptional regulator [Crocinitomicaceae bacterium CZZ-1]|uniref:Helix-turn-helix transcriptional regulator n=1 Tax=Taishania pollutisoli TaxID=2766479 RepID=A0A8J6TRP3_9FLAO|nr:AraC family transcriptional regulator [Taishania pollutisoli]MBC9811287.1 helix-turn-helix transcriptional regulator [Taishania pollutisoli]MBX2947798.1 helix-turn-helix domain-containing protein [Crocinitomicaceae bacterium]NGF75070.1 AraC family transcriptional regulator [Fluviicola sp. SGL-29]
MNFKNPSIDKYYITEVDVHADSIYCYHDVMGELLIPTHNHQKAQLIYTEGGIVHIHTSNHVYYIPPRHFMWIPAGVVHSIHTNTEKAIMRNLYFPVEKNDVLFYEQEGIYLANDLLLNLIMYTDRWRGDLHQQDKNYSIALAVKSILPELCQSSVPLSLPSPKNERLKKIIFYMTEHLEEQISYKKMSHTFGFSERSLNRLFQKETGMSFIRYFTIQKMLRAIELLLAGKHTITEVAYEVGYSSAPTFSNTFYKLLGQRPSDYLIENRIR